MAAGLIPGTGGGAGGNAFQAAGNVLGVSGQQGSYYDPMNNGIQIPRISDAGQNAMDQQYLMQQAGSNPALMQAMQQYGLGNSGMTGQQAIDQAMQGAPQGATGGQYQQAVEQQLATGPMSGSQFATEQVQNNPILGQAFGQGGTYGTASSQLNDILQNGYTQATPETQTIYGQMQGNIARQSGAQEQDLAQSLAARGLGGAASGAAGAGFTGLAGNKNEQLAQAQQQAFQMQISNNMQRQNMLQNYTNQMAGLGANAINQQYGRQMSGVENQQGQQQQVINNANEQYKNQIGLYQDQQGNAYKSALNQQSQKGPTLGQAFGAGLESSAANTGAAPGKFASSYAGKAGSNAAT